MTYSKHSRQHVALAKLGHIECVCVKSDVIEDWYLIERAVHDGREWYEEIPGGQSFMSSARLGNASIEGHGDEMLAIADAIEGRGSFSAKRCSVVALGESVALQSPRNSTMPSYISIAAADRLAASIRAVVKPKDPSL